MTPVGMNNNAAKAYSLQQPSSAQNAPKLAEEKPEAVKTEKSGVMLTEEGKALMAALSEIDKESNQVEKPSDAKSFAHGVFGMDKPEGGEGVKESEDSYTAGQFLKGAATVGALLLAVV
ncbi:hypothetical protein L3Q72_09900 [Vibrio sp. JC009]|uniref:hypothetical protein n=1 Tax=Vibrio sp. JC009 TaxID=2912314 RepID=UPI0023B15262|nr:hypothetical protein [Vibrio sp. JC009]WED20951.1 hypothetical protein L3Q72_09900 [Vibrio sp. JC009]